MQNTLLDIYVFLLPIPTLWKLQMPLRRKVAIISVFAFGGAAVIMGLIRFHSLIAVQSLFSTSRGVGELAIAAALELNLATIAVNLPALRSIWIKNSSNESTSHGSSHFQSGGNKHKSTASKCSKRAPESRELTQVSKTAPNNPVNTESQEELWGAEVSRSHGVRTLIRGTRGDTTV